MALDLHLAGFLESFAGSGAKPLPQSTPEEARGLMLDSFECLFQLFKVAQNFFI